MTASLVSRALGSPKDPIPQNETERWLPASVRSTPQHLRIDADLLWDTVAGKAWNVKVYGKGIYCSG